jgi:protease-4
MGNLAASGGYFVAAAADKIVAQPGTLTGSIGVVSGKVSLRELWDSVGVNWDGVQAGQRAAMWSPNAPFSRDEWEWLQQTLDTTYADFTGKVAAGRGLTQEDVQAVAKGQIWSGADAREAGLVDALGGYRTAIELAKAAAGLPADAEVQLRPFPEVRDPLAAIFEDTLGGSIESPATLSLLRSLARVAEVLDPLIQAAERAGGDPRSHALQSPLTVPVK